MLDQVRLAIANLAKYVNSAELSADLFRVLIIMTLSMSAEKERESKTFGSGGLPEYEI